MDIDNNKTNKYLSIASLQQKYMNCCSKIVTQRNTEKTRIFCFLKHVRKFCFTIKASNDNQI